MWRGKGDTQGPPPATLVEKGEAGLSSLSPPLPPDGSHFSLPSPPLPHLPFFPFFWLSTTQCPPHVSMVIKGEVGWVVPCIFSRSIIGLFSGDTGGACGTNLRLFLCSQRARGAPPSAQAALSDPSPFPRVL